MESMLTMTQLNDFIFCPRSLYYNGIFRNSVGTVAYHHVPQKSGLAAHAAVDESRYSSCSNVLQGIMVYCEKYNLLGRIDVFDVTKGILTERKNSITAIYDGFKFQLYAQYFALTEMGYDVKELRLYSFKDNKVYSIQKPNEDEINKFEGTLKSMREWSDETSFVPNHNKCKACIYNSLCDYYQED